MLTRRLLSQLICKGELLPSPAAPTPVAARHGTAPDAGNSTVSGSPLYTTPPGASYLAQALAAAMLRTAQCAGGEHTIVAGEHQH